MNSKMTTNSQLSTNEPKRKGKQRKQKLSKQPEEEQNQRNGLHMEGFQWHGRREEQGGKGTGNKKHKWQVQNRQGEVKNIMGNVKAKKLICMTHGHELRWGNAGGRGHAGQRGIKGRKNGTTVIT